MLDDGTEVRTLRIGYSNAHLVAKGGDAILVDAGYEGNGAKLVAAIRSAGVDPARLRAVVLTHGHVDHAGGAGYLQRTFGTRIVAGRGDAPLLAAGHNDRLCPTDGTARRQLAENQRATYTPFVAEVLVDEEVALATLVPGIKLDGRVVPLPGHTPGSLVVVVGNAAMVGDLFRGAIVGGSAERHFYMCDLDDNGADVAAVLERIAPRATFFFPGHFGPVERAAVAARFRP